MSKAIPQPKAQVLLNQLDLNVSGPIVAMICRKWDVNSTTGRYISTDFLISDGKGNLIHCTAKSKTSHNFVDRLKEGVIYSINDFSVIHNPEEYRIMKESRYMLEFHGGTTIRRSLAKPDGFVRHHFELIDFDDLEVTNNKYLIDAVGYITNVGRIIQQRTGSRTLDFHLRNQRGQTVRVTLWGNLGDVLIEKKTKSTGLHAVILTSVNVKIYNNRLYLSSSSSTMILDDVEIPMLKEFTSQASEIEIVKDGLQSDYSASRPGTLENLLLWGRNRKNDSVTFICQVTIDDINTRKGWNYPSCGSEKCKKGVTRRGGKFWCDACNKPAEYPVVRYRLELNVSDDTANAVVVMFDETATQLIKHSAESLLAGENQDADDLPALPQPLLDIIGTTHTLELKSHTYYEHGNYESFTCWAICTPDAVEEPTTVDKSAGSISLIETADYGKLEQKRLSKAPLLWTPSKPSENKSAGSLGAEDDDDQPEIHKKRKRLRLTYKSTVVEDPDTDVTLGSQEPIDCDDELGSQKKRRRYVERDTQSE